MLKVFGELSNWERELWPIDSLASAYCHSDGQSGQLIAVISETRRPRQLGDTATINALQTMIPIPAVVYWRGKNLRWWFDQHCCSFVLRWAFKGSSDGKYFAFNLVKLLYNIR